MTHGDYVAKMPNLRTMILSHYAFLVERPPSEVDIVFDSHQRFDAAPAQFIHRASVTVCTDGKLNFLTILTIGESDFEKNESLGVAWYQYYLMKALYHRVHPMVVTKMEELRRAGDIHPWFPVDLSSTVLRDVRPRVVREVQNTEDGSESRTGPPPYVENIVDGL